MNTEIALFVGVTGHRLLIGGDILELRTKVSAALAHIESKAIGVPLVLLSGLAEGADQLVAEEALKRNWKVFAVFPMPLADYLKDFETESSRNDFLRLKDRCSGIHEIPYATSQDADITEPKNQQYRNQSIYIARQSQLVIALWDGIAALTKDACGTAYVVKLCREGPPPTEGEILAAPETTSLIHIPTRRQTEPDHTPVLDKNPLATDSVYLDLCKQFGSYNRAAAKLCKVAPQKVEKSKTYLVPDFSSEETDHATQILVDQYACADALAQDRQTTRNNVVKVASIATVFAAFAQATNGLLAQTAWMILYGLAAGTAYGLYLILFKLPFYRTEDRYLEYRALAEALRVQVFWRCSGLTAVAAEHYLQLVKTEVGWVREALRSMTLYATMGSPHSKVSLSFVMKNWIDDQANYFVGKELKVVSGKSLKYKELQKKFDVAANLAMACGAILVGAAGAASMHLVPEGIKAAASAYSASFFLLGGVINGYVAAMGYSDHAVSYAKMGAIFRGAKHVLEQDDGHPVACLFALGKQALAENAEWLMQHRKNAFKVQS